MLAMDGTQITVSLIAAAGLILAGLVPTLVTLHQARGLHAGQDDIKDRVGVPNGNGSIAKMNEDQLRLLADVQSVQVQHAADDDRRFEAIYTRLEIPTEGATP